MDHFVFFGIDDKVKIDAFSFSFWCHVGGDGEVELGDVKYVMK